MLENTVADRAERAIEREVERVGSETVAMSGDRRRLSSDRSPIDDPRFAEAFATIQVYNRSLSEAIIFTYGADKQIRTLALVNPYDRPLDKVITPDKIAAAARSQRVVQINSPDRIGALTRLDYGPNTYLYAARVFDPQFREQIERANDVLQRLSVAARNDRAPTSCGSTRRCCSAR